VGAVSPKAMIQSMPRTRAVKSNYSYKQSIFNMPPFPHPTLQNKKQKTKNPKVKQEWCICESAIADHRE
jgi:hypothetical protein